MINIAGIKETCKTIVKNAPALPEELKESCACEEINGQRHYIGAYIPFVGEQYGKATKILFLCTAQNLAGKNNGVRRGYVDNPEKALNRMELSVPDTVYLDCGPVAGGILPALAGAVLLMKNNLCEESLAKALQYTAVTNFYKFSLWRNEQDLNPEKLPAAKRKEYCNFMFDHYVKLEIGALNPDYIFTFGTYRYDTLKQYIDKEKLSIKLFRIIDPAYFFHGGRLKPQPSLRDDLEKLIDGYCRYIKQRGEVNDPHFYLQYCGKTETIRQYLRTYAREVETAMAQV